MRPEQLYRSPNLLAPHYRAFRITERLLLTGHSHQAWPDCARVGQLQAWDDAAELADEKWSRAFAMADRVRHGYARLLGDTTSQYALGPSTHDLLIKWLSTLPLRERPRLVTTDGEFHAIRRQLDRLVEEGIEVHKEAAMPADTVAERLARAANDRTAAVLVSAVFYQNAHIVPGLSVVAEACARHGAELLVDVYHALDAVPFTLAAEGLDGAFLTGGGYKYCQLGEGNAFLRIPPGRTLRPVITGWFSEFSALTGRRPDSVMYGQGGDALAGATYDPTSNYRAAAVFDFFDRQGLTPAFLREVSQHQVGRLAAGFDALALDPGVIRRDRATPLSRIGGFLTLTTSRARELQQALLSRGMYTDSRGDVIRLGPAPYLADAQLEAAIGTLGEAVRALPPAR